MTVIYVASDSEGEGKTALCATLADTLRQRGVRSVVLKPFPAAGLEPGSDPDPGIYSVLLDQPADEFSGRLPADGVGKGALDKVVAAVGQTAGDVDVVLVEGSAALGEEDSRSLVEAMDARVLVVARYRRDLSVSDLQPWRERLGDRLIGFLVNGLTRHLETEARTRLLPSMESAGLQCFGLVPEDRRLLGVTVEQLAEHLDGRFVVNETNGAGLVEHLMVGGMSMDPGELYFGLRAHKAVVVRGDRPDIQMPALATETSCLVLTGGVEPIEYVKYEAEQEEVPIMVVATDTLATMDALGALFDRARFDHPLKLSRYGELLERHADLPAIFGRLGLES